VELSGSVALVTGASRGLGKAISLELCRGGSHVAMLARAREVLHRAVDEVAAARVSSEQDVFGDAGDVTSSGDVDRLVRRVIERHNRLDVLVCNAGIQGPLGLLDQVPWDEWTQAVSVNLFGVVHCLRAALPLMRQQRSGSIIVVSGGGATVPLRGMTAYAASKAAVVRLVETVALEVAGQGITINAVAPGVLDTRMLDQVLEAGPDALGPEYYQRMLEAKRSGATPLSQGAALVRFLASSAAHGISGRLISAVWDPWRELPGQREKLMQSDVYTLRRIVPADRGWQ
jgi:NAD(P)-dependent dehydrogenase (short-subunit alcohol dehydrogenase family)